MSENDCFRAFIFDLYCFKKITILEKHPSLRCTVSFSSARLDISDSVVAPDAHNKCSEALLKGAAALSLDPPAARMPRNCAESDCAAQCCFGCPRGAKKSSLRAFLLEAFAQYGVKCMTQIYVESVVTVPAARGSAKPKTVLGVLARVRSIPNHNRPQRPKTAAKGRGSAYTAAEDDDCDRELTLFIRAPSVVVSCGSLHSPALLLRSGITCQGNVGRNLRLHPTIAVYGTTPPTAAVRVWEGPMMSAFTRQMEAENGGYGAMISTPVVHPGLMTSILPWLSAEHHRRTAASLGSQAVLLAITRDHAGRGNKVVLGDDGRPEIHYFPTKQDQKMIVRAQAVALQCLAAAGASSVGTLAQCPDLAQFDLTASPGGLDAYLRRLASLGIRKFVHPVLSAHQMGTCRMGRKGHAVVDADGQCHDVAGLTVADASVFPTSLGVNPMVTVEAVALMIARRLAAKLAAAKAAQT